MAFDISVRTNLADFERGLNDLARRQMPYATALALTSLSKMVAADEVKNLSSKLKSPSPFTLRSVRTAAARKDNLSAKVYVMGKTAAYLEPYESGGLHKLSSKALLNPKNISLNQYGQLRKGTLAKFKGRSDVFIGPVKTKSGIVNGVWQRAGRGERKAGLRGTKGKVTRVGGTATSLKLLIRFGDALAVRTHLGYRARAASTVNANFDAEMSKAMAKAMASARS